MDHSHFEKNILIAEAFALRDDPPPSDALGDLALPGPPPPFGNAVNDGGGGGQQKSVPLHVHSIKPSPPPAAEVRRRTCSLEAFSNVTFTTLRKRSARHESSSLSLSLSSYPPPWHHRRSHPHRSTWGYPSSGSGGGCTRRGVCPFLSVLVGQPHHKGEHDVALGVPHHLPRQEGSASVICERRQ